MSNKVEPLNLLLVYDALHHKFALNLFACFEAIESLFRCQASRM